MLGSMAAVHLPDNPAAFDAQGQPQPAEEWRLNNELFAEFKIEVPAYFWPAAPEDAPPDLRHAYNHPAQYERLADAEEKGTLQAAQASNWTLCSPRRRKEHRRIGEKAENRPQRTQRAQERSREGHFFREAR